jgi:alkaline phosphatase
MREVSLLLLSIVLTLSSIAVDDVSCELDWSAEKQPSKWMDYSKVQLNKVLNRKLNGKIAKNVILFLGDGMGVSTVTAGRIEKGQFKNKNGEEEITNMENLDHLALSKTYNIDAQTGDSAGTATAYLTGVKAKIGTIGIDGRADNCAQLPESELESILKWAHFAGKSTGVVTTTRITHATPAGSYGHVLDRDWEGFDGVKFRQEDYDAGCRDLASQLVDRNSFINVIFGGGRKNFLKNDEYDYQMKDKRGLRIDGRNLIDDWSKKLEAEKKSHKFVWNKEEFDALKPNEQDHVMALLNYDHLNYELDRVTQNIEEPSLWNLTTKAIKLLETNPNGFFLLVEGGRIDLAHHESKAKKALWDYMAFDNAVGAALEMVDVSDDTLVTVTADHSHVFTMGGYSDRGSKITGLVKSKDTSLTSDSLSYSILSYGNGPGHLNPNRIVNLTEEVVDDSNYMYESAVHKSYETHGGEDVAIYASGPLAYLFDGTVEQSHIAHVMAYSACIGPYNSTSTGSSLCEQNRGVLVKPNTSSASSSRTYNYLFLSSIVLTFFYFTIA